MERLDSIRYLIKKGDWLVKLELKDAYLLVPIRKEDQKFLRFLWKTIAFEFKCWPVFRTALFHEINETRGLVSQRERN